MARVLMGLAFFPRGLDASSAASTDVTSSEFPTERDTFAVQLQPISEEFEQEALEINGLNRQELVAHGATPEHAMNDASAGCASKADRTEPSSWSIQD